MIPDETIERIRDAADIVQIIGEHVKLKRQGNSWRGPCPFHQGKDPNFSVIPGKGYHCFVCGESGTVFTFLQKQLGIEWIDAVRKVAERTGIEIVETRGPDNARDARDPLWEAITAAQEYFRDQLWNQEAGSEARAYLASRNVSRELADEFGLGWAPNNATAMRAHLEQLGYDTERLIAAGLLVADTEEKPEGVAPREPRARFRGRLMFPIHDAMGHPVGFGGRVLDAREPKYLNSGESAVFNKGRLLYHLHVAKNAIRKADRVLLVEGYFDAMRIAAAGLHEVIAPMGTALTEAQAETLVRYTKNIFLLYDSDKAGLKATFRAARELLAHGASVRVVTFPSGEDPDTFVAAKGAEALDKLIDGAMDVFDRQVQLLERGGWFADLHKKRVALDKLLPTIRSAKDPITRDLYLARAAEAAGVSREMLVGELANDPERRARGTSRAGSGARVVEQSDVVAPRQPAARRGERRANPEAIGESAERELTRLMLHLRGQVEAIGERIGPDTFRNRAYREIFAALLAAPDAPVDELVGAMSDDAIAVVNDFLARPDAVGDAPQRTIEDSIAGLHERDLRDRIREIDRDMTLASDEEKDVLMREKYQIAQEIRALGGRAFKQFDGSR